jgi:potassium-transporting ATPase KdpC subunit
MRLRPSTRLSTRSSALGQHLAAVRLLLVLTVVLGLAYPLAITAVAQTPGLKHHADGSLLRAAGRPVGSALIGQSFTDKDGAPLVRYFQTRPSAAGAGYDPTSTSASNLGPESVVDTLGDPAQAQNPDGDGFSPSLLSQVCARSLAVGTLEGVSGARPYCTPGGVGAVLGVFHRDGLTGPITRVVSLNEPAPATPFIATYRGVTVEPAHFGQVYRRAVVTPIRGDVAGPVRVPADAVTASASGLDRQISPAYARLQIPRVARARGLSPARVAEVVDESTSGRTLGFLGEPAVDVLRLNLALDRLDPSHTR